MRRMLAKGTPMFILLLPVLLVVTLVLWYRTGLSLLDPTFSLLVVMAILTFMVFYFFRDPERTTGEGLVAPAHGRVLAVSTDGGSTRVSTFMSPLDVHVIRAPLGGKVVSTERSGSGSLMAYKPGAENNVQLELRFEGAEVPFTVVMISGWLARRIVPYVSEGDTVARGSRIGLIRFGSRVDVIVPEGTFQVGVTEGSRVKAGSSSLGVRAS